MYLHISFTNGSNPYVQYKRRDGKFLETKRDIYNALRRWKMNYIITGHWTDTCYEAVATENINLYYFDTGKFRRHGKYGKA